MKEAAVSGNCFDYKNFFQLLAGHLDERSRRLVAAAAARSLPRGGVSTVSRLYGISRSSIDDGINDFHPEWNYTVFPREETTRRKSRERQG